MVSSYPSKWETMLSATQPTNTPKQESSIQSKRSSNEYSTEKKTVDVKADKKTTDDEEIARQHEASQTIVNQGIVFSDGGYTIEIPLSAKQRPVEVLGEVEVPIWSSRGQADVSALQELVKLGYDRKYNLKVSTNNKTQTEVEKNRQLRTKERNYWSPEAAAVYNVPIGRPSHDAWGIPKIVLLFCDDFCKDRYEFPWWNEFEDAVSPILETLQIAPARVVRLLLASLPPGITIPTHHDSGEWVKHTHRVHVPILVNDISKILFRCGKDVDSLEAIECRPGHVFEINNQAKHTVSNCDADYRVHLILDYVDSEFLVGAKERIRLAPGERLVQTRRSIDRVACKGQRPTPSFMILGAQKAGTTFLFELIMEHPLLIKPKGGRRETHCLDWRWRNDLKTTRQRRAWCLQFYHEKELEWHPSCLTGDSTPSYLIDSARVIPRLKEVFPHEMSFFVMLRDPVKRAISHYAMATSTLGTAAQLKSRGLEWRSLSFEEVVADDLMKMKDCGLIPYVHLSDNTIGTGYWSEIAIDTEKFQSFAGSKEEDNAWALYLSKHVRLNTGSYGLVSRGMYELNLRPWLRSFDPRSFLILKLEALKNGVSANETATIWKHLGVPQIESIVDDTPKNAREYDPLLANSNVQDFLQIFYQLHSQRLESMFKSSEDSFVPCFIAEHWDLEKHKHWFC